MPHRLLAIIPHYGGEFPERWSRPMVRAHRIDYLEATVRSLLPIAERVVVGVQNDRDESNVRSLGLPVDVRRIAEPRAVYLPAQLCRTLQPEAARYDLVYYTEEDQVIRLGRGEILRRVREDETTYVAPHRFTPVPERFQHLSEILGSDVRMAPIVEFDGEKYAIENLGEGVDADDDPALYVAVDVRAAYAGAYLCSSAFFRSIEYSFNRVFPTEAAGGFDAFGTRGAKALKTKAAHDFFVLHLSGREFYERLTAPRAPDGDWLVRLPDGRDVPVDEALEMFKAMHREQGLRDRRAGDREGTQSSEGLARPDVEKPNASGES